MPHIGNQDDSLLLLVVCQTLALFAEFGGLGGDVDHAPSSLELVIAAFDGHGDLLFEVLQILLAFFELCLALPYGGSPFAEIEHRIVEVDADGPEIPDKERHTVLITVPRKCRYVGNVSRLRSSHAGSRLLNRRLGGTDLGILVPRRVYILGFTQNRQI